MKTKRFIAGLLATAMVITGISVAPKQAKAEVSIGIGYEDWSVRYQEAKNLVDSKSAPEFEGFTDAVTETVVDENAAYLFGGWYVIEDDCTDGVDDGFVAVKTSADIQNSVNIYGTELSVFAKWVPASMLSIKAQNNYDAKTAGSTNTRLLSSVDCLDYQTVGFKVQLKNDPSKDLGLMETTKVYEKLSYKTENGTVKETAPSDVFNDEASYFVVWALKDIASAYYNEIIYVKPYWVTADGVTVYGLPKYVHVIDGINKYVSVSVNLTDLSKDNAVAAGVFEISYNSSKLKLATIENGKAVETGRVFGELEYADKGGKLKFAANVSNINNNAEENDIYVNLRFELLSGDIEHKGYHFEITENSEDFCDKEETKKTVNVWDVLY